MNMKIVLIMGLFIVGAMALGADAEDEFSVEEDSSRLVKMVHDYKRSSPLLQRQTRGTHGKCIGCQHWSGLCSTCCEVKNGKKSCLPCHDYLCYTCCEA